MRAPAALVAATLVACGGGDRAAATVDTAVVQSSTPIVDSPVAGDVLPDTGDSAATADTLAMAAGPTRVLIADSIAGEELFRVKGKCLACHGPAGAGLPGLGPSLGDAEWLHGDGSFAFIERSIREGIARPAAAPIAMPASGTTLTPEEIHRIAAYVYTLSNPGVAVVDTTAVVDTIPPP